MLCHAVLGYAVLCYMFEYAMLCYVMLCYTNMLCYIMIYFPGSLHILLMSFSVVKNAETLINTKVSGTRVNAIEGIRALTMGWIIVIHVLMFGAPHSGRVLLLFILY